MTTLKLSKYKCIRCNGDIEYGKSTKRYYCSDFCYNETHTKTCLICKTKYISKKKRAVFCTKCVSTPPLSHKLSNKMLGVWNCMMYRCYNPDRNVYSEYGGKGILVEQSWHHFETFYKDMYPRPEGYTLDRIDNSKGYSKDNCRWVDICEQRVNRGKFQDTKYTYKGVRANGNKWVAGIRYKNVKYYLGSFETELDAAKAYDDKMKEFYPNTYKPYLNIQED